MDVHFLLNRARKPTYTTFTEENYNGTDNQHQRRFS